MTHPIRSLRIESTWNGEPLPPEAWITLHLLRLDTGIEIRLDAPFYGDPVPPSGPPGPTDRLWEHEVVEVFLLGQDGHYTEVEMAPSGHHLVLQLHGTRNPIATLLPLDFRPVIRGERWTATAVLSSEWVPEGPIRVNATAIHGQGSNRTYSSWIPLEGEAPDFHQLERFQLVF